MKPILKCRLYEKETLFEKMFKALKSNGISVKFERVAPIWEYVHQSKNMNNPNRYVISYQQAIMSKGDKKTKVVLIAVDLMRDGKIKEEWLSYDTKGIMELMK